MLDRRRALQLGLGAFAAAALPLPLRGREEVVRRTVPVMGTTGELVVLHRDHGTAARALDAAVEALWRVDRTMTRFRPDSDVGRANRFAAREPVVVSRETARVVRASLEWSRASGGRFDASLGRAVELWTRRGRTRPPGPGELEGGAPADSWRRVEVDDGGTAPTLRFHDPRIDLDLGGIAKGYGVDAAVRALAAHGIEHAFVNVGGDLRALGRSDDGDPWEVGVRDPDDPEGLVAVLPLEAGAVATSGDYVRGFEHGGRRYHHLIDPRSGRPRRTAMRTLTVTADTCLEADAATTAAFGLPASSGSALLASAGGGCRIAHSG
jgi:thiamine biosynthesis lipoprotein